MSLTKLIRILTLTLIALYNLSELSAQEIAPIEKKYTPTTVFNGGLIGSIIYPGFNLGIERPYKYTFIEKIKRKRTLSFYKERYLSLDYHFYYQPNYHVNNFISCSWKARKQKQHGWYFDTFIGLGLSRTFVDGVSLEVSENNENSRERFSGNWYSLASFGLGVGYNANMKFQKPFSINLKHRWILLFPYNSFILPRPIIELGCNYNLNSFWKASPAFNKKTKHGKFIKSQLPKK